MGGIVIRGAGVLLELSCNSWSTMVLLQKLGHVLNEEALHFFPSQGRFSAVTWPDGIP